MHEDTDRVVCICPAHFQLFDLPQNPRVSYVYLRVPTAGALDTCVKGLLQFVATKHDPEKLLVIDGDVLYTCDVITPLRHALSSAAFAVSVIQETTGAACYSFVDGDLPHVGRVVEKERISDWAITGCYGFQNVATFLNIAGDTLKNAAYLQRGEYYMSSVLQSYLKQGLSGKAVLVAETDVHCYGTPSQLVTSVQGTGGSVSKKRFCFDLDGTLVTQPRVPGDYTTVEPITRNIRYLRFLHSNGHTVIIHTARRMRTHVGNVGAVTKDIARITLDTLDTFEIPYDEIYFGKPYADFYIDDKAVPAHGAVSKWTGVHPWYEQVDSRSFNEVVIDKEACVVTKQSMTNHAKIAAEANYYQNITVDVEDLFPRLLEWNPEKSSYKIELIYGASVSLLYVSEALTEKHLQDILTAIQRLHAVPCPRGDPATMQNPLQPFLQRAEMLAGQYRDGGLEDVFPEFHSTAAHVRAWLETYSPTSHTMVHGDPVFTNMLLSETGVKFIDMRGMCGDVVSIHGDPLYDYAKIYQSLVGYDEILHESPVNTAYKQHMLKVFWDRVPLNKTDVIHMTQMLLLTLLPLHTQRVAKECFKLAKELQASYP